MLIHRLQAQEFRQHAKLYVRFWQEESSIDAMRARFILHIGFDPDKNKGFKKYL